LKILTSGPRQILGYQYQIGMHMILCHGVHDEILRIWVADKLLWEGRAGGTTALQIDEKEFFGGDDKEGGIWGQVDFMDGNPGQGQNDYLVAKLGVGAITPAFRGVVSVVWRRGGSDATTPGRSTTRTSISVSARASSSPTMTS
jgi:hypothetical protein